MPFLRLIKKIILTAYQPFHLPIMYFRLRLSEVILPGRYYPQGQPSSRYNVGYFPDFERWFKEYIKAGNKFGRDGVRVYQARMLLDIAAECENGDYAEVGTYKGAFARMIWRAMVPGAELFCFDTFSGFGQEMVQKEKAEFGTKITSEKFSDTSIEIVRRNIIKREDSARLFLRQGFFPDTFAGLEDRHWRFVHLDLDLYESMKSGLEVFWPRLVPGGVMLFHDYSGGFFGGVKKAVDEYFDPFGIRPVPLADKAGSAVVIKPRR